MTQAFNLAQLANNLNTSGQLDATDGLNGLVANANLASSGTASSSTYLRGDRTWASLPALGKVLQVVQTFSTAYWSTSSGSLVQLNQLDLTITPSATSSRILLMYALSFSDPNNLNETGFLLRRNGSTIVQSSLGGSFNWSFDNAGTAGNTAWVLEPVAWNYVDSPNSTSAQTYTVWTQSNGGSIIALNRTVSGNVGATSTVIAMEIGA